MNFELIISILSSNVLVGIVSYLTGKGKAKAETDNTILAGLEQSVAIYRDIIEDLRGEIKNLQHKIDELEIKIEELHKENKILRSNI